MSETTHPAGGGTGGGRTMTTEYPITAAVIPPGSGLLRLGGALGIAACLVGLVIMLAACAGLNKVVALSIIPVALSLPGLVISVWGAVFQKHLVTEDTHVLHALFVNVVGLIGGLLEMAAWRSWPIFYQ
jgi:hypothetical protein